MNSNQWVLCLIECYLGIKNRLLCIFHQKLIKRTLRWWRIDKDDFLLQLPLSVRNWMRNFGCNLISTVPAIKKFLWANLLSHQARFLYLFWCILTSTYAHMHFLQGGHSSIGLMMGWLLVIATTNFGTDFRDSWLIGDYVICLKQWVGGSEKRLQQHFVAGVVNSYLRREPSPW